VFLDAFDGCVRDRRRAVPLTVFAGFLQSLEAGVRLDLPDGRIESHPRNYYFRLRNWRLRLLHF
jgi:hypothetical protein